jgi:predicted amidohydrolase YtcJ
MNSCTPKNSADLIVTNATVYLIDDGFSIAESFAVVDGKIAATGTTEEILKNILLKILSMPRASMFIRVLTMHTVISTVTQTTWHSMPICAELKSPDEIYERLKAHHEKFGGDWILGRSWDQNDWEVKEFPDKTKLDELFPNIPVYLVRVDGHAGWCNSKALEMAGITAHKSAGWGSGVEKRPAHRGFG